jgi:hypothetical protein
MTYSGAKFIFNITSQYDQTYRLLEAERDP